LIQRHVRACVGQRFGEPGACHVLE
jgi:hypothetical protein